MTKRAKFIVLEGIDNTGKTTTSHKLKQHYEAQGKTVFLYHEPYQYGSIDIKKILEGQNTDLSVLLLMMAVRDNSVKFILTPALEKYDVVISDRYFYSTYAYQKRTINQFEDILEDLLSNVNYLYPSPDKVIFFNITDFDNYTNNQSDSFERMCKSDFKRVNNLYWELFNDLTIDYLDDCEWFKCINVDQSKDPYFDFNEVLQALEGVI